jgi:hypothetical protein
MVWFANIQADTGEVLRPLHHGSEKALVDFRVPLDLYCDNKSLEADTRWFDKLDSYMSGKLCTLAQTFVDAFISEDFGDYREEDYERMRLRDAQSRGQLTKEQRLAAIVHCSNAWQPIDALSSFFEQLIAVLNDSVMEDIYFYDQSASLPTFKVTFEAIKLLRYLGARKIRIQIL